jgi:hypothetical protein
MSDAEDLAARFYRRSAQPETATHIDAAQLQDRSGGESALHQTSERLRDVLAHQPRTVRIESVDGQIEATYSALTAAIEATAVPTGERWPPP